MNKKIVAITACPAGIAHTFMAATALEKLSKKYGYSIKVEKQASLGTEDELTKQEIAEADLVIIAVNRGVNLERFKGKLLYQTSADDAIKNKNLIDEAINKSKIYEASNDNTKNNLSIMKHLMAGLTYMSAMLGIVGILFATVNIFDSYSSSYFFSQLNKMAIVGLMLVFPIYAGFVANSIGGIPAIAPAMIGGYIANNPTYLELDLKAGGGFLSAMLVGLISGYIILALKQIKWPIFFKPILGIMIFPIITSLAVMIIVTYVIGDGLAMFNSYFYQHLTTLNNEFPISKIILGAILGAMVGADFGGSINKIAILSGIVVFVDTLNLYGLSGTNFGPQSATIAAISIAPLGIWLASKIFKKYFTEEELLLADKAGSTGIWGMSEGAIPFVMAQPKQVLSSSIIGSGLTGALAYSMDLKFFYGVGSPLGTILGYVEGPIPIVSWLIVTFSGIIAVALIFTLWRVTAKKI